MNKLHAPSVITYKNMRFVITTAPSNSNLQEYVRVRILLKGNSFSSVYAAKIKAVNVKRGGKIDTLPIFC